MRNRKDDRHGEKAVHLERRALRHRACDNGVRLAGALSKGVMPGLTVLPLHEHGPEHVALEPVDNDELVRHVRDGEVTLMDVRPREAARL